MGYVPRSRLLVVGGDDGFLALVDPRRGQVVKRLAGQRDTVYTPSFSADGRLMATASDDPATEATASFACGRCPRDARSGVRCATRRSGTCRSAPTGARWPSRDPPDRGRRDRRRGPRSGAARRCRGPRRCGTSRASRPTGASSWAGAGRAGRGCGPRGPGATTAESRPAAGSPGTPDAWSGSRSAPTGTRSPPAARDGTIRLWDLPTQQPLGAPLPGLPNRTVAPAIHARRRVPVRHHQRRARLPLGRAPASWARHACAVAGRTLTRTEWQDALPDRDYNPAC